MENFDQIIIFNFLGIPINATIFYSWIVMIIIVLFSYICTRKLKSDINVSSFQTALEIIVLAVHEQVKDISNDNPRKYLPIIGTFFLFIGVSNFLTIIPWFKAPTASLSTTAAFALCVFLAMPYYGIKNAGLKTYLKKYIDPFPLMLPMNILSDFTNTFALAFRLYGNVLSGAIVGSVLTMMCPLFIPIPMQLLGLFTGMIQAYIFALLAIIYISSISPEKKFVDPIDYKLVKGE